MTSSFEKPNTKPSALSMSTTSMSSPNSSDNLVVSSSPPNPAPNTTIRMGRQATQRARSAEGGCLGQRQRRLGAHGAGPAHRLRAVQRPIGRLHDPAEVGLDAGVEALDREPG